MKKKILLALAVTVNIGFSQWQLNGVPICDTIANGGIEPLSRIATDGKGGAIICWRDARNGGDYDIYAQRISSNGFTLWQRNGIPVAALSTNQNFPRIVSDGNGGAIVAWEDTRTASNTFTYAQRIDSTGQPLWQLNGIKVADKPGLFIAIAGDKQEGVFIAWNYLGGIPIDDIVVQHLDGAGNRMWGDSGVQVTNRPGSVSSNDVAIVSDGEGGAIVAWAEGGRIYIQRIDSTGVIVWQDNGVLLSDSTKISSVVALSSDGRGGANVNWGNNDGTGSAQQINREGHVQWSDGGITLATTIGSGGVRRNISDGKGGAFIGHRQAIHHIDNSGNRLWGDRGALFYDTVGTINSRHVHDGAMGVFNFTEAYGIDGALIRAQWIDYSGRIRFGSRGTKMTPGLPTGDQFFPDAIEDGRGGAIVCWTDYRSRYQVVYAARIDTTGIVTSLHDEEHFVRVSFQLKQNFPNPFNPETTIEYYLPQRTAVTLKVFDSLGREIVTLVKEEQESGKHQVMWSGIDKHGQRVASGLYFFQLITPNQREAKKSILLK